MHLSLWSCFRCPTCHTPLHVESGDGDLAQGRGTIVCDHGHQYLVEEGIPNFVSSTTADAAHAHGQDAASVDSFGFEWQWDNLPRTEEDLRFRVLEKPNLPKQFLSGKLVLDAGCGAGLQTQTMARHGAMVIGIDLSDAVHSAARNTEVYRDRVCIARADLTRLPFADATFDYVYCEGVLQHTNDPRATFHGLTRLVKPGGQIFATFYTRREGWFAPFLFFRQPLRMVLSRLPKRLCWYICWLSIPLNRIPLLKHLFRKTIVLYDPRNPSGKGIWCLNYDFYGPHAYQSYFRPSEICAIWDGAPSRLQVLHSEHDYPLRGKKQ